MPLVANTPACAVVMEACAGAHRQARCRISLGHEAKFISPQFVSPVEQIGEIERELAQQFKNLARMAWAILAKGGHYNAHQPVAAG